jgi:UDP-N-acetylmuramoylalanine--D-glutamate ligase
MEAMHAVTSEVKQNRSALVVGLGKTGVSCVRFLHEQGFAVHVIDSRTQPPGLAELQAAFPDVEITLGDFDQLDFTRFDDLVVSPGVPLATQQIQHAIENNIPCYGDIDLFARHAKAPIIAVTGSNGKSTVVTLLTEMLNAAGKQVELGGNIGTPALDLLSRPVPDLYVLELSSFQLETTSHLNAAAAVVLNVSADHMDRYENLEAYAHSKEVIYRGDGVTVINLDDPLVSQMRMVDRNTLTFSLQDPKADFSLQEHEDSSWLFFHDEPLVDSKELKLVGSHSVSNALAALALAHAMGIDLSSMLAALREFKGLPHRTELVCEKDGIRWYNDSKGTNVGATIAAVEGMPMPVVLLMGGQAKGADFHDLNPVVQANARGVILFGQDADKIAQALQGDVPVYQAGSLLEAVQKAQAIAQPGDAVLLSPACASFDMFKNFEDRGNQFKAAVLEQVKP